MENIIKVIEILVPWPVIVFIALVCVLRTFKAELKKQFLPAAKSEVETESHSAASENWFGRGDNRLGLTCITNKHLKREEDNGAVEENNSKNGGLRR